MDAYMFGSDHEDNDQSLNQITVSSKFAKTLEKRHELATKQRIQNLSAEVTVSSGVVKAFLQSARDGIGRFSRQLSDAGETEKLALLKHLSPHSILRTLVKRHKIRLDKDALELMNSKKVNIDYPEGVSELQYELLMTETFRSSELSIIKWVKATAYKSRSIAEEKKAAEASKDAVEKPKLSKRKIRGRGCGRGRGLDHNGEPPFVEMHPSWQCKRRMIRPQIKTVSKAIREMDRHEIIMVSETNTTN